MLFGKKISKYFLCKVSIFLLLILASTNFVYAENGVPSTISYQGHLSDSGGNLLGGTGTPYYFKFSFWDSPTVGSGNKVWPASAPTATSLTVRQGVFSVNIGDVANGYPDTLNYDFNTNKNIYLQVEISSDNSTFETLSPRSSITSSAFSQVADRVVGTSQSSFGTTTPITNSLISAITTGINQVAMTIKGLAGQVANLFNIQDSTGNSLFTVTADGKVGVGTSTPSTALTLGSGQLLVPNGNSSLPSLVGHNSTLAGIYFSGGTTVITAANGATPNYTNLTVNTAGIGTNRSFISTGNGSASAPIFISNYDLNTGIFSPAADMWAVTTGGIERLRINDFGNIGIGVTNPVASLNLATSTGGFIVGTTTAQSNIYNGIFGPTTATAGNTLFAVKSMGTMGNGGSIFTALTSNNVGLRVTESGGVYMSSNVQMTGGPVTLALGGNTNTNTISSSNSGAALNTDFLFKAGSADRTAGNLFQVSNFTNPVLTISALTGTGNVGVGTTTPGAKLDVWGNLNVGTSSTPILFVNSATNFVGFGTANPTNPLHIISPGSVGLAALKLNDAGSGVWADFNDGGSNRLFRIERFNNGARLSTWSGGASNITLSPGNAASIVVAQGTTSQTADIFQVRNSSDTVLFNTTASGNVGIGTTTPDNPLNIYFNSSNTYLPGVKLQNTNSSGKALFSAHNNLGKSLSMGIFGSSFGVGLANTATLSSSDGIVLMTDGEVANGGTNSIQFRTGGYNTTQERMRIDYLGKVGIGSTTPSAKLAIEAGTASTKGLVIQGVTSQSVSLQEWLTSDSGDFAKINNNGTFEIRNNDTSSEKALISLYGPYGSMAFFGTHFTTPNINLADSTSLNLVRGGGNVGIGPYLGIPGSKLAVNANATIGAGYGLISAPTNGLLVEGSVGIGTTTPSAKLTLLANTGDTNTYIMNVSSSTASSANSLFRVKNDGRVFVGPSDVTNSISILNINGNTYTSGDMVVGGTLYMPTLSAGANSNLRLATYNQPYVYLTRDITNSQDLKFGIGTTTPAFPLDVYSTVSSDQTYGYLNASGLIGTSAGTNSYSIRSMGRILAPEFNAVSDARLKDVQFELDSEMALELITQLKPVSFKWKNDPEGQPVLGFLAQDVEQIIPNAVSKIATAKFSDQRTLDYNQLISVVIGAIKDLAMKVSNISRWFSNGGDQLNIQGEVCVDDVCVTKDQFKEILRDSGGFISTVEENSNVTIPAETSTTTSEETNSSTTLETIPVSEPEFVAPEVISEPEPVAPVDNPAPEPII